MKKVVLALVAFSLSYSTNASSSLKDIPIVFNVYANPDADLKNIATINQLGKLVEFRMNRSQYTAEYEREQFRAGSNCDEEDVKEEKRSSKRHFAVATNNSQNWSMDVFQVFYHYGNANCEGQPYAVSIDKK